MTAGSCRRPVIQRPVGTAGSDVGLIEPLEDVVRRRGVVQIVALVERACFEQVVALAAHVTNLDDHVRAKLSLHAEVVLLDPGRHQIAIDRPELEGLGHVAAERLRRSISAKRHVGVVADLVGAALRQPS